MLFRQTKNKLKSASPESHIWAACSDIALPLLSHTFETTRKSFSSPHLATYWSMRCNSAGEVRSWGTSSDFLQDQDIYTNSENNLRWNGTGGSHILQRMPASLSVSGCFYRSSMCSPACPTTFASSLRCDEMLSAWLSLVPTCWQLRLWLSLIHLGLKGENKTRRISLESTEPCSSDLKKGTSGKSTNLTP